MTEAYAWSVGRLLRGSFLVCLVYAGLLWLTYGTFSSAPTGFVPEQDQGRLIVNVQLPDSASLQRTQAAMAQIDRITRETPGVAHAIAISGISFVQSANSSNFGSMFVILDPFEQRQSPGLRDTAIMAKLREEWAPAGQGRPGDRLRSTADPRAERRRRVQAHGRGPGGLGLPDLQRQTDSLITASSPGCPGLTGVSAQFRSNTPQLFMDIDRTKVEALGRPAPGPEPDAPDLPGIALRE